MRLRTAKSGDSRTVTRRRSAAAPKWNAAVQSADEQYERKRRALLTEAGRAFRRKGFHNTSLDEVASSLNVTKPALYYYFKNKHEILYECHKIAMDLGDEAIRHAEANGRNGREKLALWLTRYLELLTGELGSCAMLTEHSAMRPRDREEIQKRRRGFDTYLRGLIEEGKKDGSIRSVDAKLATFFFMGGVNGVLRWFKEEGEQPGSEIALCFVDFLLGGIASGRR